MGLQIIDTTALSNFAHIKRVDLLRLALGDEAAITRSFVKSFKWVKSREECPFLIGNGFPSFDCLVEKKYYTRN